MGEIFDNGAVVSRDTQHLADQHMSFAARKPQSRAEAEANARTLRNLVKQPDNKVCVDCKRNDTRWAAWNLGCFLCIRCSGIHRSMGTHISRVKSIDLDMWTEEQMQSVIKWGNKRANLYWEANLKAGHVPPDHKIESFIRSKYESRRWALPTPLPEDPSVLTGEAPAAPAAAPAAPAARAAKPAAASNPLLDFLSDGPSVPPTAPAAAPAAPAVTPAAPAAAPAAAAPPARGAGIFDLEWDASPAPAPAQAPKASKGKQDILSLFSSPPPTAPASDSLFGAPAAADPSPSFGAFAAPAPPRSGASDMINTQDVWGAPSASAAPKQAPASDAFADIWGEFK